jgi:drug efflux transport system permease protein
VSFRRLWAVTRKEILHISRDRMTLVLVLITPLVLLLIMAYALTVDLNNIPIAVLDYSQSSMSRAFIQQITAGPDLALYSHSSTMAEIEDDLLRGNIKAALIIGPAFEDDLLSLRGFPIQVIIDGTEPESGWFAVDHIGSRAEEYVNSAIASQLEALGVTGDSLQPIDLRVQAWYNPSLKSRNDLIPGLISMVLGLPALSVALTLAHEREHGTLEQLMASPIRRVELLLGKILPYLFVGLVNVVLMPVLAILWFHIPFNGSFPLYFVLSAMFLFAILSMGVLVGVFMPTQASALALSFLVVFFPAFFLTGIFFPIASMPEVVRLESLFLPGTHYAIITRGIFLTGIGLKILWPYGVMLFVLGLAFTGIAALFFRKRLK